MNDKLAHLSTNELHELIDRYYKREKVTVLIKDYNIDTTPNSLVHLFPPKEIDELCPFCNVKLILEYQSRERSWQNSPYCPNCNHQKDRYCRCVNCKMAEQLRIKIEQQEAQDFLQSLFYDSTKYQKVDIESFSFEEKIYIGALLREGISEDFNFINPIASFDNPLAPTPTFISEIINILADKKAIAVHPESNLYCFKDKEGNYKYLPLEVKWVLNIQKKGVDYISLIESLITPDEMNFSNEEAYQLWKKISLHEVLEYLCYKIGKVFKIEYNAGKKTITVINDLLREYSVSQIYTIIGSSIGKAASFKLEFGAIPNHAANTVIGKAQNYAERAKVKNWDILKSGRLKDCPESALSMYFFERVLKIGYVGFDEKPRILDEIVNI